MVTLPHAQNMTTEEDDQMMEVDDGGTQECCPICYTEYQTTSGTEYARIVCSGRCQTFSMVSLALSIIYTTSLFFFQSTYLTRHLSSYTVSFVRLSTIDISIKSICGR